MQQIRLWEQNRIMILIRTYKYKNGREFLMRLRTANGVDASNIKYAPHITHHIVSSMHRLQDVDVDHFQP